MDPFATVTDLVVRWRSLSSAEETVVATTLLEDASDMVRSRWPDMDSRIATGGIQENTVIRVVAGMVRRAMMNRDVEGVTQLQQTTGPFSDGATFSNPNNNLYFSADDVRALDPYGYSSRSRMGWLA